MRRGVNLGGFDVVPPRPVPAEWLDLVRDTGFDTVRLPVRWAAWCAPRPPYAIDPAFAAGVDAAVDAALGRGFTVVVDVHHYADVEGDRLVGLWSQLATRYADRPAALWLELLNEPPLAVPQWNALLRRALAAVRAVDPGRTVVVGPAPMNEVAALPGLDLPADDRLVATVHYYEPMPFTHQGAPWVPGAEAWRDVAWGSDADHAAVTADLERVAAYGRPVFVGEFGTYERADPDSRVRWTAHVRAELDRLRLDWCYWDFATDFGMYDPRARAWRDPLRKALAP
jgi:endoglucanase